MIDPQRLRAASATVRADLLAACQRDGTWLGQHAASPTATATALSALSIARQQARTLSAEQLAKSGGRALLGQLEDESLDALMLSALHWLEGQQNADGGWGDSDRSPSNLAATLLVRAAFQLLGVPAAAPLLIEQADAYIARHGGVRGLKRRYAPWRTLVAPTLANCALAGLISWHEVPSRAVETGALSGWLAGLLPHREPAWARAGSMAACLARFHQHSSANRLLRPLRRRSVEQTLDELASLQAASGAFQDCVPQTAFVVMCLAGAGRVDHDVVLRGVRYLLSAANENGHWPIETNRATHVTALATHSLASLDRAETPDSGNELPLAEWQRWLHARQHQPRDPHLPGACAGWARGATEGSIPNVVDTAGAMLALAAIATKEANLRRAAERNSIPLPAAAVPNQRSLNGAIDWLLVVQNDDGGWPTFARGAGRWAGDRSATDSTALAVQALAAWSHAGAEGSTNRSESVPRAVRTRMAIDRAMAWLELQQQADGSWAPLWLRNAQFPREENPICGTARVLAAYRVLNRLWAAPARRGLDWLLANQHPSGGWGIWCRLAEPQAATSREENERRVPRNGRPVEVSGRRDSPSAANVPKSPPACVEESSLAVEMLLSDPRMEFDAIFQTQVAKGLGWLVDTVEADQHQERAAPIGFHPLGFWYYEPLYPLIFAAAALTAAEACSTHTHVIRPASIEVVGS